MSDSMNKVSASDGPRTLFEGEPDRILSRADCEALFKRIVAMTTGGGDTSVTIRSTWTTNLRWARNRPTMSGDTTAYSVEITRIMPGKYVSQELSQLDDAKLKETVQDLETRLASMKPEDGQLSLLPKQEYLKAPIWSDSTYQMTCKDLSEAVQTGVAAAVDAKLDAAGYSEVGATSWAIFNTRGLDAYAAATGALYTETVRNREGSASGWAGESHNDWAKLDVKALSNTALRKCRDSANPVKIEPGRYTTILEPKAVANMVHAAVRLMDRRRAEEGNIAYTKVQATDSQRGISKIGDQIFDERITITSDPTDPDCAYIPFDPGGNPYRKVNWVENGVLKELSYNRAYARKYLNSDVALPNPWAFRVSGGTTSIEEMIATTERGIYVTHFGRMSTNDDDEWLTLVNQVAPTHDGLWLIEHGKIVHPIKNLWINDSPMIMLNQILQLGPPVRTVGMQIWYSSGVDRELPSMALSNGYAPAVAPAMKVRDFNFTRLMDAI